MTARLSSRSPRPSFARLAAVVACTGLAAAASGQVQFELVPHGLDFENADAILAGGLSLDGSVHGIGYRGFDGWITSYRFAHPGTLAALPSACDSFPDVNLSVISGDGSTFGGIVWECNTTPGGVNGAAYWTAADGTVFLGSFPNGVDWISGEPSAVTAISENGMVLVGTGNGATDPGDIEGTAYVHAFRVVRPSNTLEDLGVMPGSSYSRAMGISADGTKVLTRGEVATYNDLGEITHSLHVASIWTEADAHQVLPPGDFPPEYNGGFIPWGISPDGGTVVGSAARWLWRPNNFGYPLGYKWSAGAGYVPIPSREDVNLPVCRPSRASAGGAVVVGTLSPPSNIGTHAFVWDEEHGTRLVGEIVAEAGYDVAGWTFTNVTGLSADGSTLVGTVVRPHPDLGIVFDVYRLVLSSGSCPVDWNDDAAVNSGDISAFLTSWLASVQAPDLVADFNGDGATNSGDISSFLTSWLDAVTNGC